MGSSQTAMMPYSWEGNRRIGVALASGLSTCELHGLQEHAAYASLRSMAPRQMLLLLLNQQCQSIERNSVSFYQRIWRYINFYFYFF